MKRYEAYLDKRKMRGLQSEKGYSCFFSGFDSNTGSKKMAAITNMKFKQSEITETQKLETAELSVNTSTSQKYTIICLYRALTQPLLLKNKMNLLTKTWNISTSKRDGVSSVLKFGRRTAK